MDQNSKDQIVELKNTPMMEYLKQELGMNFKIGPDEIFGVGMYYIEGKHYVTWYRQIGGVEQITLKHTNEEITVSNNIGSKNQELIRELDQIADDAERKASNLLTAVRAVRKLSSGYLAKARSLVRELPPSDNL